jgi:hypothetical protein
MPARWPLIVAIAIALSACTTETVTVSGSPPPVSPSAGASVSTPPGGATLADGSALPASCAGRTSADQTVAFVAGGRAWAMDPRTQTLTCLFRVGDPGPFAFGPQGDRVLLADLQVRGLSPDAPTWPAGPQTPSVFDWGHPIGLAVVYADASGPVRKRLMDTGKTETLSDLPSGHYQAVAYHPSGLALGFIVDEGRRQGIWISSNEGKDPQRLVFSKPDTVFSSITFSPDGRRIWWIAQHAGALSEIHFMDLADRSGFSQVLSRGLDPTAHGLLLAPSGPLMAATEGATCDDEQAMVIDDQGAHPIGPAGGGPTHAVGWLDASTLLIAQGGCGGLANLYAVTWHGPGAGSALLVSGVDVGATRTILHDAPTEVPAPPQDASPAPPGGVG